MQTTTVNAIPVITRQSLKIASGDWKIDYYDHYQTLVYPQGQLHPELMKLIKYLDDYPQITAFRYHLEEKSFHYLCSLHPKEKCIRVGSDRLSLELAILHWFELYQHQQATEVRERILSLKAHVESIKAVEQEKAPSRLELISHAQKLPFLWQTDLMPEVEALTQKKTQDLVQKMHQYQSSRFEKLSDYALGLSASFALIRVNILKFLALLPSLEHNRSGSEVKRLFLETLRRLSEQSQIAKRKNLVGQNRTLPKFQMKLLFITNFLSRLTPAFPLAVTIRWGVRKMAKRFIAGENITKIHHSLKHLAQTGRDATLDQLGELVVSEGEAELYLQKVLELVRGLGKYIKAGDKNSAGIYRAHVSIKVSALAHNLKPYAFDEAYAAIAPKLTLILLEAKKNQVFVNIDAEHYHLRDLVFQIYAKVLLSHQELRHYSQTGIVVQAYLKDASFHLNDILELAKQRQTLMPIRLVKGAYWDAETVEADAHNFIAPQFLNKEETDLHFRQLAFQILKNDKYLQLSLASHNLSDHCWVRALREIKFSHAPEIEHQCLHMTYEALSEALPKMQWPTRNYIPVGNLLVGMAYLVRRIMENSSQVGVLTIMRSHKKASKLESPERVFLRQRTQGQLIREKSERTIHLDFFNVPPVRLYFEKTRIDFFKVLKDFSVKQSSLLSQKEILNGEVNICLNPANNAELAQMRFANLTDTKQALEAATLAIKSSWWSQINPLLRYSVLLRVAEQMTINRYELSALIISESGKSMSEALADVDEAIDFINFYVREEMKLQRRFPYASARGVMAVIAPWNFPLAIPCGMVVSSLVAGNPTILKSAEQTPLVAQAMVNLFHQAGVPKNILFHLPGEGETIGAELVKSSLVSGIVFTGSKSVGQWIYQNASAQMIHFDNKIIQKRVITEMGGKNAIIITNNCELDETVSGILYSAYAHAGQKCSAASRILVHEEVKQMFLERFVPAARGLKVGSGAGPGTYINPLINLNEKKRVIQAVKEACLEANAHGGQVHLDRSQETLPGAGVGPVILEVPIDRAFNPESWSQKEIFGPVVHVITYRNLAQAVEIFNATPYALTGGIYSQSQDDVDYLLERLQAGNLYVNRPNTGARVGIEPFGGFKLSGTGPKAGSREYLKSFHLFVETQLTFTKVNESISAFESDYHYQIPKASKLSPEGRKARLLNVISDFSQNASLYNLDNSSLNQEKCHSFFKFIKNELLNYQKGNHPNLMIPGQLSYNAKNFAQERGALIIDNEKPTLRTLLNFFAAVAVGCGITIISRNEKAAEYWSRLVMLFHQNGFSKQNLDHYFGSKVIEDKILQDKEFSFLIIDADSKQTQKLLLKSQFIDMQFMKTILTNFDGPPFYDWDGFLDQFTLVRSFAINTMRHGAPLDLSI